MPANEARDDGDRWFDLDALAEYSSLSARTLRRHLTDPVHPLPHHQVQPTGKGRGRVLVSKRAFDQWMEQFKVGRGSIGGDADWVRRGFDK